MKNKTLLIFLLLLFNSLILVSAVVPRGSGFIESSNQNAPVDGEDVISGISEIIINSEDWRDVYSGIHFGNLIKSNVEFLTKAEDSSILLKNLDINEPLLILSSRKNQIDSNFNGDVIRRGFANLGEINENNLNLQLIQIESLEDINNFIIISNSHSYGAIAVAPYAVQTNSWIFFADSENIDEITKILSNRPVNNILIYGYSDKEVKEKLQKYSPHIISSGNPYKDNVEITKKFLEISPSTQVLLTEGTFIEKDLMEGMKPVLFTGKENAPDTIKDYLKNSSLETGTLIGNELVGAATNIKQSTGLYVMVKFARGDRVQQGEVSAVEGLRTFNLPSKIEDYETSNELEGEIKIPKKEELPTQEKAKNESMVAEEPNITPIGDAEEEKCSSGCEYNGRCIPIGTRLTNEDKESYCEISGSLENQKEEDERCQNDFECLSGECKEGRCISLQNELEETNKKIREVESRVEEQGNMIERIFKFLRGLVGFD